MDQAARCSLMATALLPCVLGLSKARIAAIEHNPIVAVPPGNSLTIKKLKYFNGQIAS